MVRKLVKLLCVVLWMGLIYSFSSDSGNVSTKKSDGVIIRVVETFMGRKLSNDEKEKWINYLVVPVRKGAHIGIYFVLGILIFSFVSEFLVVSYKIVFLSLGIAVLYACSDEFHQLLVPGRSGEVVDVIWDTIGSYLGIVFSNFIVRMWNRNEQKERTS